ncbi:MAG: type II toxin-antitoxin system HicB family antitoxin, partial [Candidatus Dormibacteraceae bacterium]
MAKIAMQLMVESEEVPGRGWVVEAQDVNAIAQGETLAEALDNLKEVIETYPEILIPLAGPESRKMLHPHHP